MPWKCPSDSPGVNSWLWTLKHQRALRSRSPAQPLALPRAVRWSQLPLGSLTTAEEPSAPPQPCASSFHLYTQSPASLQEIPRTNRLAAIFSRSCCHCLGSRQGNIFLMFSPNPKHREKKKDIIPHVVCSNWCARSQINKQELHSVPNTLSKALPSWPVQSVVPE